MASKKAAPAVLSPEEVSGLLSHLTKKMNRYELSAEQVKATQSLLDRIDAAILALDRATAALNAGGRDDR